MGRAVLRKYRRILTRFWNRYNSELVAYTELLEQSFNLGVLKKKKKQTVVILLTGMFFWHHTAILTVEGSNSWLLYFQYLTAQGTLKSFLNHELPWTLRNTMAWRIQQPDQNPSSGTHQPLSGSYSISSDPSSVERDYNGVRTKWMATDRALKIFPGTW